MVDAVAIFGLPGAGKSLLAEKLQERHPETILFDSDLMAAALVKNGVAEQPAFDLAAEIFIRIVRANRSAPGRMVFIDSLSDKGRAEALINFADTGTVPLTFVEIHTSEAKSLERVARRGGGTVVCDDPDSVRAKRKILDGIVFPDCHRIDNSDDGGIDDKVDRLEAFLGKSPQGNLHAACLERGANAPVASTRPVS